MTPSEAAANLYSEKIVPLLRFKKLPKGTAKKLCVAFVDLKCDSINLDQVRAGVADRRGVTVETLRQKYEKLLSLIKEVNGDDNI